MADLSHRFCACGCGQRTLRMTKTNRPQGRVKGYANRYLAGHVPVHLLRAPRVPRIKTPEEVAAAREKVRRKSSEAYYRHREKRLATEREKRLANPEFYRAKYREGYERHKERRKAGVRAWAAANPEKVREYQRRSSPRRRAAKRNTACGVVDPLVVLEMDDGVCGICGGDVDPMVFQVDHIIPLARGGEHLYSNTQVAHAVCNQRKGAKWPFSLSAE